MKTIIAISLILLSGLVGAQGSASADPFQGLVDIRKHAIESESVGETYEFLVALPAGYAESPDRKYPTLYLTDGAALLPMLLGYYRYLYFAEEVPEIIFVALSYSDNDWTMGNNRSHDYSAPSVERDDYGGAADFQAMLRNEIMPLVEGQYRSRGDRRIVYGQSMGAQFVMYTAHTQPDLFWGHIASNPAMHRNVEFFLPDATEISDQPVSRLFVGTAENDDPRFKVPTMQWIEEWSGQPKKPWLLQVESLDGHNHFSAAPASFRRGMKWLFSSATIPRPAGD